MRPSVYRYTSKRLSVRGRQAAFTTLAAADGDARSARRNNARRRVTCEKSGHALSCGPPPSPPQPFEPRYVHQFDSDPCARLSLDCLGFVVRRPPPLGGRRKVLHEFVHVLHLGRHGRLRGHKGSEVRWATLGRHSSATVASLRHASGTGSPLGPRGLPRQTSAPLDRPVGGRVVCCERGGV